MAEWLDSEIGAALVSEAMARVLKQYRMDEEGARAVVEETFEKSPKLRDVVAEAASAERAMRTRAFDDALTTAKRNAYQALRRYSADADRQRALIAEFGNTCSAGEFVATRAAALALAQTHASTRERFAEHGEFYRHLTEAVGTPNSVLDAGCGMHPLLYPLEEFDAPQIYAAADKDVASITALQHYATALKRTKLTAINWNLEEGWGPIVSNAGVTTFDVAFLFKVVPVVERQEQDLLQTLADVPARKLVITGSRISLTKRQHIERRERGAIRRFCALTGGQICAEFTVGEEFAVVVER